MTGESTTSKSFLPVALLLIVLHAAPVHAQWERVDGPYGGDIIDVVSVKDSVIYCLEKSGDIFISTRDSLRWRFYAHPPAMLDDIEWISVENDGNLYMLGSSGAKYRSMLHRFDSAAKSWIPVINRLSSTGRIVDYAVSNEGVLFACITSNPISRSDDSGRTWTYVEMNSSVTEGVDKTVLFFDRAGAVYCNSGMQLYRSADHGDSWSEIGENRTLHTTIAHKAVNFHVVHDTLVIGLDADANVIKSSVHSREWDVVFQTDSWTSYSRNLYVSTDNVLWYNIETDIHGTTHAYYSTDLGETWVRAEMNGQRIIQFKIAFQHENLVMGYNNHELIHISKDFARTWNINTEGISRTYSWMTALRDTNFYVRTSWMAYRHEPFLQSWTPLLRYPWDNGEKLDIDSAGVVYKRDIYRITWSTDRGNQFNNHESVQNNDFLVDNNDDVVIAGKRFLSFTNDSFVTRRHIGSFPAQKIATSQSGRLFGISDERKYVLLDSYYDGANPRDAPFLHPPIYAVAIDDLGNLIASCESGVFISHDDGRNWITIRGRYEAKFKKIIRDWRQQYYAIDDSSQVYHSYDGGQTWVDLRFESEFGDIEITDIVSDDSLLYVSTWGYGLFSRALPSLTNIGRIRINPLGYSLLDAFPNPSSTAMAIAFKLPHGTTGQISITDVLGREIMRYQNLSGNRTLQWGLTNTAGRRIAPGLYMISLMNSNERIVNSVIIK